MQTFTASEKKADICLQIQPYTLVRCYMKIDQTVIPVIRWKNKQGLKPMHHAGKYSCLCLYKKYIEEALQSECELTTVKSYIYIIYNYMFTYLCHIKFYKHL